MSRRELLERLAGSTGKFLRDFSHLVPQQLPLKSGSEAITPLDLTGKTEDFRRQITRAGLIPQLHTLAISKSLELEALYQRSHTQACRRLVSTSTRVDDPHLAVALQNLRSSLEHLYSHQDLPRLMKDILHAKAKICRTLNDRKGNKYCKDKRPFKHVRIYPTFSYST